MARILVIGDTHFPIVHKNYFAHCQRVQEAWNCNRVLHIGDVFDFHAISYHERDPDLHSARAEIDASLRIAEKWYSAFPKMEILTGNHDALINRQAKSASLPSCFVRTVGDLLIDYKGWQWLPRWHVHKIEGVMYAHGDRGFRGINAALKNAIHEGASYVQGHLHTQAGCMWSANERSRIFGLFTGCGIDRNAAAAAYARNFHKKPILGCGVVVDGDWACFEPLIPR